MQERLGAAFSFHFPSPNSTVFHLVLQESLVVSRTGAGVAVDTEALSTHQIMQTDAFPVHLAYLNEDVLPKVL